MTNQALFLLVWRTLLLPTMDVICLWPPALDGDMPHRHRRRGGQLAPHQGAQREGLWTLARATQAAQNFSTASGELRDGMFILIFI